MHLCCLQIFHCFILIAISKCFAMWLPHFTSKQFILSPAVPQRPFLAVWNVETERCLSKYNVNIDLSSFDIIANPKLKRSGSNMVIFYSGGFGLYPHFDSERNPINGGLPQNGNIYAHYKKCVHDIIRFIPDKKFHGLAVIDWESWMPVWEHNAWGFAKIYQKESEAKVERQHPEWSKEHILLQAKAEFEKAAKNYMLGTLELAQLLRPNAFWGYYRFPECYNYPKPGRNFSCHKIIMDNNKIEWLFTQSSALYPSTYLELYFRNSNYTSLYVGNRIKEALRVDKRRNSSDAIPVYAYNNLVYRRTSQFLSYQDIVHSSGIAAVLGASGIVIWGDNMQGSKSRCKQLKSYVETTLGPYLKLASDSASLCSLELCKGHGRCVINQQQFGTRDIPELMLQFLEITLFDMPGKYSVACQCYPGFHGVSCQEHA